MVGWLFTMLLWYNEIKHSQLPLKSLHGINIVFVFFSMCLMFFFLDHFCKIILLKVDKITFLHIYAKSRK